MHPILNNVIFVLIGMVIGGYLVVKLTHKAIDEYRNAYTVLEKVHATLRAEYAKLEAEVAKFRATVTKVL